MFGPSSSRNFSIRLPKKVRRKAMAGILTQKMIDSAILELDSFSFDEIKTKNAISTLHALSCQDDKTLIVVDSDSRLVYKSFNNLPRVKVLSAHYINPRDMLQHTKVVFIGKAFDVVQNNLSI